MRILLTGATGFVGSHLLKKLAEDGHAIYALVRPTSRLHSLENVVSSGNVELIHYDGNTEKLLETFQFFQADAVIHLASCFLAEHKFTDIPALIESNVLFGTQLLEASVQSNVKYFINTGTSWQHYQNEDYNPVCLYAATKQAFEAVLKYYAETSPLRCCTLKLFDTYGPEDYRGKLFSFLRKAAGSTEPLAMSGGEQLLDIVYIDDVVEAYVAALQWLMDNDPEGQLPDFAVTSGSPISLRDVVGSYEKIVGKKLPIQWGKRSYRQREVMVPWNRGNTVPGWKAKVDLSQGIKKMEGLKS